MVDELILYDDMQYTKRDWRNRNKIKTKDGVQWISIPVEVKGNYFQKIADTKIAEDGWAENHWKTIFHNYAKANHFKEYKEIFENAFINNQEKNLSKVNYNFIKLICGVLGINTEIKWSSDFTLVEGKTERLVDLCKQTGGTEYYTGSAAKAYMDESLFENENIKLVYFDYSGYQPYTQLYGEFVHEVSVLDLLFNEGPNARNFMKSFNHQHVK